MSEQVLSALVGVGGAVLVAITSTITQWRTTKLAIQADHQKIMDQIVGEMKAGSLERRHERLLEALSELLAASDPQVAPGGDYSTTVRLITRIQLMLNLQSPPEARLNGCLNRLGLVLQEYVAAQEYDIDQKSTETSALLAAHADVIDAARSVVAQPTPNM